MATPALAESESAAHSMPAAEIDVRLQGIRKTYGDVVAVDRIDLEIAAGEFFTMLGPSGSGKTTTLRLIAGFERPDDGRIELVVRSHAPGRAECSVVRGGLLGERKGVSVPGRPVPMPGHGVQ